VDLGRPDDEVVLGDFVLRLDGTVVEVLAAPGISHRFHVSHVAVEAKERGDGGLRLHVGIEAGGVVQQGARFDVPAERRAEVEALFERARAARERIG
jgi:hypothetical protein